MERQVFITRTIPLDNEYRRGVVMALLPNLPLNADLEAVIRTKPKARKPDQNKLMWAGPLADIAEQGWHNGRQFSAELWHELFKIMYLPEDDDPDLESLVMDGYRKWDYLPNGDRVCVGSTTKLKVKGMTLYLTQIEAHGASMGVQFHANPRERVAA